jgi:hypothetical protein
VSLFISGFSSLFDVISFSLPKRKFKSPSYTLSFVISFFAKLFAASLFSRSINVSALF